MKNKYLKSFLALFSGNGFTQVVYLVFIVILVRMMTTEYYAVYRQGNLLIMTFAPILSLGLSVSIGYFIPRCETKGEKKTYVYQTVLTLLIMGLIWLTTLILFSEFISKTYNNPLLKRYIWAFGIMGLSINLFSFYPFFMAAEGRNRKLAKTQIVFALIKLSSVVFYLLSGYRADVFFGMYALTELMKALYACYDVIMYFREENAQYSRKTLIRQIRFSIPIALTNLVASYNRNIDKNFVSVSANTDSYAAYTNGAFEIPLISVIRKSMTGALIPGFAEEYDDDNQDSLNRISNIFRKSASYSAAILLPLMFSLMLYARGAMLFLFSEKYAYATPIFIIYLLILPTQITDFSLPLIAAEKQRYVVIFRVIGAVLNTILCTILSIVFKDFRLIAIAPVLTEYVVMFAVVIKASKVYKQKRIMAFLPVVELMKISALSIVICILFYYIGTFVNISEVYKSMIFAPICFIICTGASMILFDYTRDVLKRLLSRVARKR